MDSQETAVSPQRRTSWTGALGAKLHKILSPGEEQKIVHEEEDTLAGDVPSLKAWPRRGRATVVGGKEEELERSTTASTDRSVSRGREAFSSGRGGIGNMHRPSVDTASPSRPVTGEPLSPVRGREATVDPERAKSTGRGGMGNIRSKSRARSSSKVPEQYPQTASLVSDQATNVAEYEKYVLQQSEEAAKAGVRSSGRGGLGNIKSSSKSRSRSRVPQVLSTGRGGAGNLQPGANIDPEYLSQLEEEERLRYAHEGGIHSTGRGGRANLTSLPSPPPEPGSPHLQEFETTGRGGAGNIVRSRSASRGPDLDQSRSRSASRGPSSSRDRGSSLARMLNKVGIHHAHGEEDASPLGMTAVAEDGEPAAHAPPSKVQE